MHFTKFCFFLKVLASMILLVLIVLDASALSAETRLQLYPVCPAHRSDGKISGSVNDMPLEFEYFRNIDRHYYEINYAHFAADGPVCVDLNIKGSVKDASLRTVRKDISFQQHGSQLKFVLPGPGHYYLKLPHMGQPQPGKEDSGTYTVIFFIDDLFKMTDKKMNPDGQDVIVITSKGVISDPTLDQTDQIQALLDDGGQIYFSAGIYRTGSLRIPSNTTIYMEPGSILKAVDDPSKINGEYLKISQVENVRIYGPGIIDANYDSARYDENIHIINTDKARNLIFEDIIIQNSVSWALHILRSEFVTVRNIKVFSGKDGIDPDSSSDVLVENVCVLAYDDAVAIKVRKRGYSTERVAIRNSIMASKASALKVGTETRGPIRDITFENCEVFDSDRGIILYARDGGPVENVTWRDIRLSMIYWPTEDGGSPIQLVIKNRDESSPTPTPVRDCAIENVVAFPTQACEFRGLADTPLKGVELKNITFNVLPPGENRPPLIRSYDHVALTIQGLEVNWQGHRHLWKGLLSGSGVIVEKSN